MIIKIKVVSNGRGNGLNFMALTFDLQHLVLIVIIWQNKASWIIKKIAQ